MIVSVQMRRRRYSGVLRRCLRKDGCDASEEGGGFMATRLSAIAPYFLVADVVGAAEYYRDKLGFTIRGYFFEDPPVFAMIGRDELIIMLALMEGGRGGSNRDHKSVGLDAYLWTEDADAIYAEFRHSGADIVAPPVMRSYGMKEFEVRDLDGYVLCFGQDVQQAAE
jgi:uncharacterized glyoxalase superfamily protein PhnB